MPDHRIRRDEIVGPVSGSEVPRYAGESTFARLPRVDEVDRADVAVVGVPFDSGVSYRPGARFGPGAVRQASRLLRPYDPAFGADPFLEQQVVDAGDIVCTPFDITEAVDQIERAATELSAGGSTKLLTIGGDHTIALPLLRTVHRVHGPIALVHFDAHLDTWDTYFEAEYTHGTPFRRAFEEGLLAKERSCHVGTRGSLYSPDDLLEDSDMGFRHFTSNMVGTEGVEKVMAAVRDRVGDLPVYVSVDIDVLDPAHAPGTGTPEAGGLTSRELLHMLRELIPTNVVGADVVEVAPAYDHAETTAVAAAHVAYSMLSLFAIRRRSGS